MLGCCPFINPIPNENALVNADWPNRRSPKEIEAGEVGGSTE